MFVALLCFQDVKKFIEESEHGIIYISFGSMLKAAATSLDKIEAILGAVAELPQRVIWKWEEGTLPGNPKNIFISNWLPQNDILGKLLRNSFEREKDNTIKVQDRVSYILIHNIIHYNEQKH